MCCSSVSRSGLRQQAVWVGTGSNRKQALQADEGSAPTDAQEGERRQRGGRKRGKQKASASLHGHAAVDRVRLAGDVSGGCRGHGRAAGWAGRQNSRRRQQRTGHEGNAWCTSAHASSRTFPDGAPNPLPHSLAQAHQGPGPSPTHHTTTTTHAHTPPRLTGVQCQEAHQAGHLLGLAVAACRRPAEMQHESGASAALQLCAAGLRRFP
jgi:hypothetical protein